MRQNIIRMGLSLTPMLKLDLKKRFQSFVTSIQASCTLEIQLAHHQSNADMKQDGRVAKCVLAGQISFGLCAVLGFHGVLALPT